MTLAKKYRKQVGRELWTRLLDAHVQLALLWQDKLSGRWQAYGHWPYEADDSWWKSGTDPLATGMASGDTPQAATEALLSDSRLQRPSLAASLRRNAIERSRLTEAYRARR